MSDVIVMVTYGCGTNLANCYSVVSSNSYENAMKLISSATEGKYAFTYIGQEEIDNQVSRFNLKKVPLQPQGVL